MKWLIVNGDDFGAGDGINRGIAEAHCRGILTSASLMVGLPFSREAARLSRELPHLSVGLHVHLPPGDPDGGAELRRQFDDFLELMGRPPTHLDSHHDAHRHPGMLPHFLAQARQHGLPLRGHSPVRRLAQFYGQWDGVSHLEQVSVPSLVRMLRAEVGAGYTELICHPGHADPNFRSSYASERAVELATLCDLGIRALLPELQIQLIGFRDLPGLLRSEPA
jgi:predicted glycoside hydrolase/deacetylase ChbG (UPF0249 family)